MKKRVEKFRRWPYRYLLYGIGFILLIIFSNLYLQWCQNNLSVDLAFKFAFSWHTEKFFLGCFVLSVFLLFLCSLAGSLGVGALLYSVIIGVLGFADYQKMFYRVEPIYPDDLKMITEVSLLKEMVGLWPFVFVVALGCVALFFLGKAFYKSFFLSKKKQTIRVLSLVLSIGLFSYIGDFNNPQNLLRKAYNKTALWIPYSQKMNYYNTGFIGGLAVGLGLMGYRAIGEFQFADYILPATNQLLSEARTMRYRTKGDWTAPIVYRTPYGGGVRGGLYHSQSTEKVFCGQPGLRVVTPSNPYDAKGMIKAAIRSDDPVIFYEHKRLYRLLKDEVPADDYIVPIDKANVVRTGSDLTVISYGMTLQLALAAAEKLAAEGIDAEIVDVRSLYPLDRETLVAAAKKTGKVLLVTEDNKEGSVMSEIAAMISEDALFDLDAPIQRLAGPDCPSMPYALPLEREFLINEEQVLAAMKELAEF